MTERNVGISQQTLVSDVENENVPAKKFPQYLAVLSATLGGIAVGMVVGWSSSAGDGGKVLQDVYKIEISFIVAWSLIIFANSVLMFYMGRFFAGFSVGAFSVAAPIYSAEIAETKIRGTLVSYTPLSFSVGILISYIFASFLDIRELSIASGIVPFIFFGIFVFMPESPMYYMQKGDEDSLLSVCVFIIAFNIGFGPAPWIVLGEVFAPEVKDVAASGAVLLTWLLTFVVTKFYTDLKLAIGRGITFWLFSVMSAIATFFVYFIVPETKGKSLIDIQRDLQNSRVLLP